MKGKKLVYNVIKCGVEFYSFLFCFRLGPKIISTAERSHSTPVFSSAAPPHCHLRGALKKNPAHIWDEWVIYDVGYVYIHSAYFIIDVVARYSTF